ncbi:MAG: Hsp70 family protein [Granulosicoccus sp.]
MSSNAGGIDFGTSNSSVGYVYEGVPRLVSFGNDGTSIPSAIFYASESPEVSFGKRAVSLYTEDVEGRLLRSLKSVLGSSLMGEKTTIRNKRVPFADIIQDFFGFLKSNLSRPDDISIDQVVIGRPVHFVDDNSENDRLAEQQLREIAHNAGFRHVEFQFEPIAAALSYESRLKTEERVLIVDVGGGTADFSIIDLSPGKHEATDRSSDILATMGIHIGGTDFDRLLSLQSVMPLLGMGSAVKDSTRLLPQSLYFDLATWHRIPLMYNTTVLNIAKQMQLDAVDKNKVQLLIDTIEGRYGHELARTVEQAKIELSKIDGTQFTLAMLGDFSSRRIKRTEFETAIESAVEQLSSCIKQGLIDAQIKPEELTSVFYTGGSSSVPCLQSQIRELFPQARQVQGDTFGSVGLGLTLDAARKFG